ncbi:DEKNAAC102997 [Brettanomyces naardenensis]|uniref:DEKNAAC102997 n=1 Tax=Brettanomyces naardenensis TaxID=13370 RepID=A0A448YM91_BRENA|nr:DEKNAAC102997 [Brettanomyces naardenensis]
MAHEEHSLEDPYKDSIVDRISMPELVKVQKIDELKTDWEGRDSVEFFEGRIVLTPKPIISSNLEQETVYGSLWSKPFKKSTGLDEVEIQLTLRSVGSFGNTGAGFSFFLVNDDDKVFATYNKNNFGGPSKFSGLQISLDGSHAKFGPSLRVYLNDGSKDINLDTDVLGAYRYEYQASNVPLTLKVGYSKNWLKITCDNKLLFQTDRISLSDLIGSPNFRLGLTAESPKDVKKYEQFEILRLKTYNQVSAELKSESRETLVARHIENDSSFRSKEKSLREQLAQKSGGDVPPTADLLQDIYKKLSAVEDALQQQPILQSDEQDGSGSNSQTNLQKQIFLLMKTMDRLTDNVNNVLRKSEESDKRSVVLERKYDKLTELLNRQSELLENAEASSRTIGKSFQQQMENFGQTLDSKVSNMHAEYVSKVGLMQNPEVEAKLNGLASFVKIVFLPLVALCCIIVLLVARLRNDIKHAKVL